MARGRRLTDQERHLRTVTGGQLQREITDLAVILGWSWGHFRAAQTRSGRWQVPVEGPLASGWPDLFLAHPLRGRLLAVEVKRETADAPTPDQVRVHDVLRAAGLEVHVFRPSDIADPIERSRVFEVLR